MISHDDVIRAFVDKLAEYGISLRDPSGLKLDGRWHRAHVEGDRNRDGLSYKIFFDDAPAGYFKYHKAGIEGTFSAKSSEPVDEQERARMRAEWRAKQEAREREQAREYARAAAQAKELYEVGDKMPSHPYLERKGLKPTSGVSVSASDLIVPTYSELGVIASAQRISVDGEKKYLPGGRMSGCFHAIVGNDKRRVLIAEGYATGVALNAATGHPVACAMSSGQIKAVADYFAGKFPDREIVVCADNDHHTEAEKGINPGLEAASNSGYRFVYPRFNRDDPSTDWEDYLRANGEHGRDVLVGMLETPPHPDPDEEPDRIAIIEPQGRFYVSGEDVADFDPGNPETPALTGRVVDLPPTSRASYDSMQTWSAMGLVLLDNGTPLAHLDNAVRVLQTHDEITGRIWYDEFLQRILTTWTPDQTEREWCDADDVRLTLWFQRVVGIRKMTTSIAREAANVYAFAHSRNEAQEWLNGLRWDKQPRLASLFPIGFSVERNAYSEAVSRCWLVSMVARVLSPGCKVDTMPVLEGAQGKRKSSALQALVGKRWFAEAAESPTGKDFFQALTGKMLVEIGELDSFNKSEVSTIKRVVSCQVDRYRSPYGRRAEDHPRTSVFAGTVNGDDWNRDDTGARRFWPMTVGDVNVEWLAENREQLFAEAVNEYRTRPVWWDVPADDALREQAARREADEWETPIATWLLGKAEVVVGDVLRGALGIEEADWDKARQMRAAKALKALGWVKTTAWRGGRAVKVWTGGKGGEEILL